MRVTRAYIAGFGTAGSLLAGAALVFVLASGVIAFRGWPQVGDPVAPVSVVIPHARAATASNTAKRLTAAVATFAQAPAGAAHAGRTHTLRTGGPAGSAGTGSGHHALALTTGPPRTSTPSQLAPAQPPAACASCGAPAPPSQIGTFVQGATGAVSTTVKQTGRSLGSTVNGLAGTVANKLAPVSPGLAKTVQNAGSALGNTITNATGTLSGVVSGAGNLLSGQK
jgi:hypothetical protein